MRRAITPIIAVILLIVMTVGISAFVFIWMQNFVGNLQQTTQQQLETLQRPQFIITYATVTSNNTITLILANAGTVPIDTTNNQMTAILEEYSKVTGSRNRTLTGTLSCSPQALQARQQANCSVSGLSNINIANNYYVLTLSYQGVTASYRIS